MKCNICGGTQFIDQGSRQNVRCTDCGSLERTRMLWLTLERMEITHNTRILHIAPDKGIYNKLAEVVAPENYHTADLFPELFESFAPQTHKIDLCALEDWPDQDYDLIVHAHVMEHIPCNLAYPFYHLHRMLKPEGKHAFIVPFFNGKYEECFQDISETERVRRLGQKDHVRRFGKADIPAHLGAIVNMPEPPDAKAEFGEDLLLENNIPERNWYGFTGTSVIVLGRNDMKFL